jgi:deazaflavin-dependent oxidoreductase (nitroreductase family)
MGETRLPPFTPGQERFGSIAIKLMTRANTWIYRLTEGRIGGRFRGGAPVCLVTMRGRKSGEPRTVALLYLEDGDDVIIVASKGGMSKHPLWFHNLKADPDVELQIGGTKRAMRARQVSDQEKAALWPRLTGMYPDFNDYQGRTTRNIPVLRLSPR